MSLSDLASLGSFVSGLAVLASLILLFFQLRQVNQQVRQSEKNQQALMRQALSARSFEVSLKAVEPAVAESLMSVIEGGESITETALLQHACYSRAAFISWGDAFFQARDGQVSSSAFDSLGRTVGQVMRNIFFRTEWRLQRATFEPEFVAWMDGLVASAPSLEMG